MPMISGDIVCQPVLTLKTDILNSTLAYELHMNIFVSVLMLLQRKF